jgi:hypothetical protein
LFVHHLFMPNSIVLIAAALAVAVGCVSTGDAMYTYLHAGEERCYSEEVVRNSEDMAIRVDIFYNIERADATGMEFHLNIHKVSEAGKRLTEGSQSFKLAPNEPEVVSFTAHYTSTYHLCFVSKGSIGGPASKLELDIMGSKGSIPEDQGRSRHKAARPIKKAMYDAKVSEVERLMDTLKANAASSLEEQTRFDETVASTFFRVIAFTVANVVIMVVAGLWQLLTLKNFFKNKKVV